MAGNDYELGTAWIQVALSGKNITRDIQSQIDGVDVSKAEKGIVGRLGGAFTKVGKIAAGALAIGSTVALAAGFSSIASEAITASDATDKFKNTLGFAGQSSADIERLTRSTKDYADKTVYGLSDIQSITAQLAANNVADYDKLAEATGNLNAVAGGNAETFKSVGMVLTQTAGQGKLTTENFNQLADAVPGASGKLQQALLEAGAYTGNFRDAMAAGEITAQEFNDSVLNLGFTEAAQEAATSTTTIEGAWGNLQATLVSGAMGFVDRIKPALTDFLGSVASGAETAFAWIDSTLIPGLEGVYNVLANGEFSGPIFGFEEDSGFVDFLFNLRETGIATWDWIQGTLIPGIQGLYDILINGDFSGPIFGFEEDSAFVDFLFNLREAAIDAGAAIVDISTWVIDNRDAITSLVAAALPAVAVIKTWTTVSKGMVAVQAAGGIMKWVQATRIGTGVQAAFNAVMSANPIMLVVAALAAVVAGLAYFFTQTETGKRVWGEITEAFSGFVSWISGYWNGALEAVSSTWTSVWTTVSEFGSTVWEGIKAAIGVVVDWISTYVAPVLSAVWEGIKIGAWILATAVALYFQAWKAVIGVVVDWISTYVWPVIQAAWDGIKAGAQTLWEWMQIAWDGIKVAVAVVADWLTTYVQPVISTVWDAIKVGADLLWQGIQAAWDGIKAAANTVADWFQAYVQPVISAVWTAIKVGADLLWQGLQAAWNGIQAAVNTVASWFTTYVQPVITGVWTAIKDQANNLWTNLSSIWDGIKSTINTVVDWMKTTLQNSVTTVTDGIKSSFQTMKDGISSIWDSVKGVAAKPINFIIGTVYTDGIKKTADSIAEKLGLSLRLPSVSKIPGYASGGVLPGYTPGRDIYHFTSHDGGGSLALSGGEAIMVPEWTRAVGGRRAVKAMNDAARRGRSLPFGDTGTQAFADGGIWDKIKNRVAGGIDAVTGWVSSASDAVASIVSDPYGAVENLIKIPVDALMGSLPGTGFFTDMARDLPYRWIKGFGDYLNSEAPAISASDLVSQARLAIGTPYVWGGVSMPGGLDCSGLIVWALRQMGHNVPRHTAATFQANSTPVGSPIPGDLAFWGYPAHHVAIVSGNGMMVEAPTFGMTVRETPIYGGPSYGRFKYDDGGLLQPGLTLVENATGKPEPVFTSSQWDKINGNIGLPRTVILKPKDGREFEAYLEEVADSRIVEASREG